MGISRDLARLIETVKNEDVHKLTRSELYRFGIDTRPSPESMWSLEQWIRPFVHKIAMIRQADGTTFRTMEWRLFCENNRRVPMTVVADIEEAATGRSAILMTAEVDEGEQAGGFMVRTGKSEIWSGTVYSDMVEAVLASRYVKVTETRQMPKGETDTTRLDVDTAGLSLAWTELSAACRTGKFGTVGTWPSTIMPSDVRAAPSTAR
jgi:hypothetical protein